MNPNLLLLCHHPAIPPEILEAAQEIRIVKARDAFQEYDAAIADYNKNLPFLIILREAYVHPYFRHPE